MKAEIIAIGTEILLGEIIDTNSAYIARQLPELGIDLLHKSVVGDNMGRISDVFQRAWGRSDLIITTGGLGPTVDDVTREGVAQALGRPLEFHQHLLEQIEARFRSFGRAMSPSNRRQAFVPQGARIVENPRGTAPSFIVEDQRATVIVLPGFDEARALALMPRLDIFFGVPAVYQQLALHPELERADLARVRSWGCGGAPLADVLVELYAANGVKVIQRTLKIFFIGQDRNGCRALIGISVCNPGRIESPPKNSP